MLRTRVGQWELDATNVVKGHAEMVFALRTYWGGRVLGQIGKFASRDAANFLRDSLRIRGANRGQKSRGTLARAIERSYKVLPQPGGSILAEGFLATLPPYWPLVEWGRIIVQNYGFTVMFANSPVGPIAIQSYGYGYWQDPFTKQRYPHSKRGKSGQGDDWIEDPSGKPMMNPKRGIKFMSGHHFVEVWFNQTVKRALRRSVDGWAQMATRLSVVR